MISDADKNTLDAFSRELRQALQRITGKVLEPEDLPIPLDDEQHQQDLSRHTAKSPEIKTNENAEDERTA